MSQAIAGIEDDIGAAGAELAPAHARLLPLAEIPRAQWDALAANAIEANGFFDPGFALAAAAHARHGGGAMALAAHSGGRLTGLLPVTTAARALKLPLPVLVSTQPYNSLTTPLLDRHSAERAAGALLDAAAAAGKPLLVLQMAALEGPAYEALQAAAATRGLEIVCDNAYERATLSTELDDETYLRSGLGSKKLKELRRQGHRLADEGAVAFTVATTPETVAVALERFLALEARGWKGKRRTGLGQDAGDARFVRAMAADMSARGAFEIAELTLEGATIASGLVMRQGDRALFFKIAYDEGMARFSVGVQLTLELTRRFIADKSLKLFDSTASAEHPMIDHVWRERLKVGDLYIQTRRGDALGPLLGKLIRLRHDARDQLKRLYHLVRNRLEKTS
jgi:CelD/BcsL family acetyltransferase involved in cellulose biosynthesis